MKYHLVPFWLWALGLSGIGTFLFCMFLRSFHNPTISFRKGFSLTEMLVIILIIILLTTTVAVQFPSLYRNYLLSGTAQDIVLTIREAQQYSTNVKPAGGAERYGVYLNATTKQMIFFLDNPGAGTQRAYDSGTDTDIKKTDLDPSLSLTFLVAPAGGSPISPASNGISIMFDRPNLAPFVRNQHNGAIGTLYSAVDQLRLTLTGAEKSIAIEVYPTGSISM